MNIINCANYQNKTKQHMPFTCIQKQALRKAAFKKYLWNLNGSNRSSISLDLSTLRLFKYYILHYHDKFTIYIFFLPQSSDSYEKLPGNNSLNRLLFWTKLSSIKSRKNYQAYLLTTLYVNVFCIFVTSHCLVCLENFI